MLTRNAVASCSTSFASRSPRSLLVARQVSSSSSSPPSSPPAETPSRPATSSLPFSRNSALVRTLLDALVAGGSLPQSPDAPPDVVKAQREANALYKQHGWTARKSHRPPPSSSAAAVAKRADLGKSRGFATSARGEKKRKVSMPSGARKASEELQAARASVAGSFEEPEMVLRKEKKVAPMGKPQYKVGQLIESRTQSLGGLINVIVGKDRDGYYRLLGRAGLSLVRNDQDFTYIFPDAFLSADEAALCLPGSEETHAQIQRLRQQQVLLDAQTAFLVSRGALDLPGALVGTVETVTPDEALQCLGLPSPHSSVQHYAMHCLLMADAIHFVADSSRHSVTNTFRLRSKPEVDRLLLVRSWFRDGTPQLTNFVHRAALASLFAKANPPSFDPTRASEPLRTIPGPQEATWDESDREIIKFLRKAFDKTRLIQSQPYLTIAPSIIKLVDDRIAALTSSASSTPDSHLNLDLGFEISSSMNAVEGETQDTASEADEGQYRRERIGAFLGEIGVVAPWENWAAHEADGVLAKWHDAEKDLPSPSTLRTESLVDPLDAHRRDFGELPVYVIDDLGAQELDDGLGIQAGPSTSNGGKTWWVHVHIADPTAVLRPDSPVAKLAALRVQAEYLPEGTWSMLPQSVSKLKGMSLGSMEGGKEQKVLSFSVRVDEEGEMLESKVEAGVVRKLVALTYDAVDRVLGYEAPTVKRLFSEAPRHGVDFGIRPLSRATRRLDNDVLTSSPAVMKDIETLYRLSNAVMAKRATHALYWNTPRAQTSVSPNLQPHHTPSAPTFYRDAPLVSLTLLSTPSTLGAEPPMLSPAQLLVSEWMISANRLAARYCLEHSLPIPYRTQNAPPIDSSLLATILAARNPSTGQIPTRDLHLITGGMLNVPAAETGLSPKSGHWMMGIRDEWGYAKVTSPLRRYSDMLAHWQIKASLLPGSERRKLPFDEKAVLDAIRVEEETLRARGKMDRQSHTFWATYLLQRKLRPFASSSTVSGIRRGGEEREDLEASEVLESLTGLALTPAFQNTYLACWSQKLLIPELGLSATLDSPSEGDTIPIGEATNVRIKRLELSDRSAVFVELRR